MKWKRTVLRNSFALSVGLSTVVLGHSACVQTQPVTISSESTTITAEEI